MSKDILLQLIDKLPFFRRPTGTGASAPVILCSSNFIWKMQALRLKSLKHDLKGRGLSSVMLVSVMQLWLPFHVVAQQGRGRTISFSAFQLGSWSSETLALEVWPIARASQANAEPPGSQVAFGVDAFHLQIGECLISMFNKWHWYEMVVFICFQAVSYILGCVSWWICTQVVCPFFQHSWV